jgi:hypothetical protein
MNINEIEKLLEKYYEGQTTLEEELRLREFFLKDIVPPHLAEHADLFRALESSREEELSDPDFEKRFLSAIRETPVIGLQSVNRRLMYITSLAAGFLILIGLFFTFQRDIFNRSADKSDPKMKVAFAETQKALLLLSGNFNTGLNQIKKLSAFDNGVSQVQNLGHFHDGIQQAQKLKEFYKIQTLIINPDGNSRSQNH